MTRSQFAAIWHGFLTMAESARHAFEEGRMNERGMEAARYVQSECEARAKLALCYLNRSEDWMVQEKLARGESLFSTDFRPPHDLAGKTSSTRTRNLT
jgi:hypothetical protein